MTTTMTSTKIHEGRNVKRIRDILQIKQEVLADELGISQQSVSLLEQKETLDPQMLEKVAKVLKVPAEAIKNFDESAAVNIIGNTVTNHDQAAFFNYNPTFNPIDKWVEALDEYKKVVEENKKLYERLLQVEKEKNELLERLSKKQ